MSCLVTIYRPQYELFHLKQNDPVPQPVLHRYKNTGLSYLPGIL